MSGNIFVFLAALVWGLSFVGQSTGMEVMGPLSFSAVRITLGAFSMLPLSIVLDYIKKKKDSSYNAILEYKKAIIPALICTPILLSTIMFQQYGLIYTSVGKCAFITAFYLFLVPFFGIFVGKRPPLKAWLLVIIAMFGLYLITMSSGFDNINTGDIITFGAAIMFSVYIRVLEVVSSKSDSIKFSMFQFLFCGIICFIAAPLLEPGQITWDNYVYSLPSIIVTGVFSCGAGYTLQIVGQARTSANTASLILSSETVISMLAGFVFLGEILTPKEYIGCALMCVAILISVIPGKAKSSEATQT